MKITRKELDRNIKMSVKKIKKLYGYSTRDLVLYKKNSEYFFSVLIFSTGVNNNLINARGNLKPYFSDDIFWDVFQMSENSNKPVGLRADGAFSIRGLEVYNEYKQIDDYANVEGYVEELLEQCDTKLLGIANEYGSEFKKFIDYSKTVKNPGLYNHALVEMLFYIKEHEYIKAKNLAVYELGKGRRGNFKNKGKDIYEHIVEFCDLR